MNPKFLHTVMFFLFERKKTRTISEGTVAFVNAYLAILMNLLLLLSSQMVRPRYSKLVPFFEYPVKQRCPTFIKIKD